MKLGIIISQTNPETVWNAFRLANFAIKQGDGVKIFLPGEGVEYEASSSEKFNIEEQIAELLRSDKAQIMRCWYPNRSQKTKGGQKGQGVILGLFL